MILYEFYLDFVWVLTTDKIISASNGQILEKPRQAQYLTHATFVPNNTPQGRKKIYSSIYFYLIYTYN